MWSTHFLIVLSILMLPFSAISAEEILEKNTDNLVFAVVGEEEISVVAFNSILQASARRKFFHGNVTADQWDSFRKEIAWAVVDRHLLLQEAKRRNIEADRNFVQKELQKLPQRDIDKSTEILEEENRIAQLRSSIENAVAINDEDVINYYKTHPEKFTVPERFKVRLILLKVPPYAPLSEWDAALQRGRMIYEQTKKDADFGGLARKHSNHESAAEGGSLGIIHKGMFAKEVQDTIDQMKPGDISEPLRLLQGIVLLQLEEKLAPSLQSFETVKLRAATILLEERKLQVWNQFLEGLRQKTPITINWAAF